MKMITINDREAVTARRPDLFEVRLLNKELQDVVFLEDGQQKLTLEIRSTSEETITLKKLTGQKPGAENYHFAIKFRPGILNLIRPINKGELCCNKEYEFGYEESRDGGVEFYFICKGEYALKPDESIGITLNSVTINSTGGTRSSAVLVKFKNLLYSTNQEELEAERRVCFNIINNRGKRHLPIYTHFVGQGVVLNDKQTHSLTIRLTNLSDQKIELSKSNGSKFIIALSKEVFSIEPPTIKKPNGWEVHYDNQQAIKGNNKEEDNSSITLQEEGLKYWTVQLAPTKEVFLEGTDTSKCFFMRKGYMEFEISNLSTKAPAGETHLSIRYENIPGYKDGEIILPIKVQPLMYDDKNVHIVTSLTIENTCITEGDLTVKKKLIADNAEVQGSLKVGSLEVNGFNPTMRGHLFLYPYEGKGSEDGNVYIQAREMHKENSISMMFRTQEKGKYVDALQIKSNGDVQIPGVLTTGKSLVVGGPDLRLGPSDRRGDQTKLTLRALVHGVSNGKHVLIINYGNDYNGGVVINGGEKGVTFTGVVTIHEITLTKMHFDVLDKLVRGRLCVAIKSTAANMYLENYGNKCANPGQESFEPNTVQFRDGDPVPTTRFLLKIRDCTEQTQYEPK
jgi:hypothetical protein